MSSELYQLFEFIKSQQETVIICYKSFVHANYCLPYPTNVFELFYQRLGESNTNEPVINYADMNVASVKRTPFSDASSSPILTLKVVGVECGEYYKTSQNSLNSNSNAIHTW